MVHYSSKKYSYVVFSVFSGKQSPGNDGKKILKKEEVERLKKEKGRLTEKKEERLKEEKERLKEEEERLNRTGAGEKSKR